MTMHPAVQTLAAIAVGTRAVNISGGFLVTQREFSLSIPSTFCMLSSISLHVFMTGKCT